MPARLCFSLVLWLLMYVPRSTPRPGELPGGMPPSPDELPPGAGADAPDDGFELPAPPRSPMPRVPSLPPRHGGRLPSVPPTPPPGYEGEWPPRSERPAAPPTPPPGHHGPWPGRPGIHLQVRDLLEQVRELLRRDDATTHRHHAVQGTANLGASEAALLEAADAYLGPEDPTTEA